MGFQGIFIGMSFLFTGLPVVLVLGLVVVLALHRDEDTDGNRAPAIYAALVAFVGFFALLVAAPVAASALINLSRETYGGGHDAETAMFVLGIIIALVGFGILVLHRGLFERMRVATGAGGRVRRSYALVMCFVTVLVGAAAAMLALYQVAAMVASDTFGTTSGDAARAFVPAVALLVAAMAIGRLHWEEAGVSATSAA
jgi:hypothetical protein